MSEPIKAYIWKSPISGLVRANIMLAGVEMVMDEALLWELSKTVANATKWIENARNGRLSSDEQKRLENGGLIA